MCKENHSCVDHDLIARASDVVDRLKHKHLTVITAESCTGGLVSAVLSQAPGASDVLQGGFVTYTKANKQTALGVDRELLRTQGSVSEEVARQLASGALERSPADLAIAITGVLGPEPDEDGNPVGLVFLGFRLRNGEATIVRKDYGTLPHDCLRRKTVLDALALADDFVSRD
jgi:nicotinamide-nucleotide amidase